MHLVGLYTYVLHHLYLSFLFFSSFYHGADIFIVLKYLFQAYVNCIFIEPSYISIRSLASQRF